MNEMRIWEKENFDQIVGWSVDWEIKPGFKIIIFTLLDNTKVKFEIQMEVPS